ncbi:hypothetical protein [Sphingobacterium sp. SGL-16]|uniref:hypothetical protein n=1 Tax=Sphingobacterium sp. SGL-16 TaxID=2710883 RepID=UPI0013E9D90A|nr:hypothetical protein [Sphingobacterium sp. SGL-16]NGM72744.1 hypothetical protein [Sphingobacterium sp. SGL-16]
MMKNSIYTEKQSFWTWWLGVLFGVVLYMQLEPIFSGEKNLDSSTIIALGIVGTVLLLMLLLRLRTTIDDHGITIRFFPFVRKKTWEWEQISEVFVTEYSIADYGGWGYRVSSKGKAYNTKGKYGLQLILKNGARIMVGTQNPEVVKQVIEDLKK